MFSRLIIDDNLKQNWPQNNKIHITFLAASNASVAVVGDFVTTISKCKCRLSSDNSTREALLNGKDKYS
jgi:hypothetical protein